MSKLLGFGFLWYIFGNPFIAIIVLLLIIYFIDRRFIGLTPSIIRPFKVSRNIAKLRNELRLNPHNTSSKLELARLLIEKKKYQEAIELLEQTRNRMEDSADLHAELGLCYLKTGNLKQGEAMMNRALELNPRVKYGEPYLRLAESYASNNEPDKAFAVLEQFRHINSSSCEAYYRLGMLYQSLGKENEAKQAFKETRQIYKSLPKYSRRQQRKWAILASFKR